MAIRQKTVVDQLVKELRKMLVNGEYKSFDKIPTENELADKFGVSRSSVREALKILSYLGILESHTSKGTFITDNNRIAEETTSWALLLSYEKVNEVFVFGTALDTQVAIILMKNFKNAKRQQVWLIKEMKKIIKKMHDAAYDGNVQLFQEEFSNYFRTTYNASGNSVFVSLNECIDSLIVAQICKAYDQTNNLKTATNYLENIWNCISNCEFYKAIDIIQDYGSFAYNVFLSIEMSESDVDT